MRRIILNKFKYRSFLKFGLFILFSAFVFFVIFYTSSYFRVKKIEISGDVQLKGLQIIENKIIFFISDNYIGKELLRLNPHVSEILISKKYPNSVRILVTRDPAIAYLQATEGYFLLNEQGKILKKTKDEISSFPKINYYQKLNYFSYSVGDIVDYEDMLNALCFVRNSSLVGIIIQDVDIRGQDMIILKSEDSTFFASTGKSCQKQLEELKFIIKRYNIEGRKIKSLDLRYEKPVVVFN